MQRLNRLEDILFPVEEHPVFVMVAGASGEKRLPVPDKKAIVNAAKGRVLGIMSRGYRLVSNREALDWARQCCHTVFPETKPGEWGVKYVDSPSTGGHCFIDLVHNSAKLDFGDVSAEQRPEVYGPFIRVTNSYNGLRALGFDIGFFRKVCENGLILPEAIIRFKFNHLNREIGEDLTFDVAQERLAKFKASFEEYLGALRKYPVSLNDFGPLVCGALSLRKPEPLKLETQEAVERTALCDHVGDLSRRYAGELGENAYAVFNVITDFASRPPQNRCVRRERHSLQRLAGSWLSSFSQESSEPNFNLSDYIGRITKANSVSGASPEPTMDEMSR